MSESEIRAMLLELGLSPENAERVMDAVNDYAQERASDEAYSALREYEERM